MPFAVPNFNLQFDYWTPGTTPNADPFFESFSGQLYFNSRSFADTQPGSNLLWPPAVYIRLSISQFYNLNPPVVGGICQFFDTAATPWCFLIRWWCHTHPGFSNEYISLHVDQCDGAGTTPDPAR